MSSRGWRRSCSPQTAESQGYRPGYVVTSVVQRRRGSSPTSRRRSWPTCTATAGCRTWTSPPDQPGPPRRPRRPRCLALMKPGRLHPGRLQRLPLRLQRVRRAVPLRGSAGRAPTGAPTRPRSCGPSRGSAPPSSAPGPTTSGPPTPGATPPGAAAPGARERRLRLLPLHRRRAGDVLIQKKKKKIYGPRCPARSASTSQAHGRC